MSGSSRPLVQFRVLALGADEVDLNSLHLWYPPWGEQQIEDETRVSFTSCSYTMVFAVAARNMNWWVGQDTLK